MVLDEPCKSPYLDNRPQNMIAMQVNNQPQCRCLVFSSSITEKHKRTEALNIAVEPGHEKYGLTTLE